eukprot:scaffold4064_cov355-Prasinococcus_capsulatus_cf.AAC.4
MRALAPASGPDRCFRAGILLPVLALCLARALAGRPASVPAHPLRARTPSRRHPQLEPFLRLPVRLGVCGGGGAAQPCGRVAPAAAAVLVLLMGAAAASCAAGLFVAPPAGWLGLSKARRAAQFQWRGEGSRRRPGRLEGDRCGSAAVAFATTTIIIIMLLLLQWRLPLRLLLLPVLVRRLAALCAGGRISIAGGCQHVLAAV